MIGARIKAARLAAGLGLRELARAIGKSPTLISRLEHGREVSIGAETAVALARAIGLDSDGLCEAFGVAPEDATPTTAEEIRACRRALARLRR